MHQPFCLSVCLSAHLPIKVSVTLTRGCQQGEEGWQRDRELTGTGDTSLVSHLGTWKRWSWEVTQTDETNAGSPLTWVGTDIANKGAFRLRAPFENSKLKQSKPHVDVGFWIPPCLEYQQGSGLCDLHSCVFIWNISRVQDCVTYTVVCLSSGSGKPEKRKKSFSKEGKNCGC